MTKKNYHHGDLRAALIAEGRALLEDGGLAGLNLREVARRVGVSPAAPYRHFDSAEALAAAIAAEGFDRLSLALATAREGEGGGSSLERLGLAYGGFARANKGVFRLMFSGFFADKGPYPDVEAAGMRAHAVLVLSVKESAPGAGPDTVGAAWALLHGWSVLATEGLMTPGALGASDDAEAIQALQGVLKRGWQTAKKGKA